MMGYYDVSVIVDGALDGEEEVSDAGDALDAALDNIRAEHAWRHVGTGDWEVFVLHHPHASGVECECIQYATDHHPALVLRDGAEVDPS